MWRGPKRVAAYTVFISLEKADDRVPKEELWYCMKTSGLAERYCESSEGYIIKGNMTRNRCSEGMTDGFEMKAWDSVLRPLIFAMVMATLTDEIR